MIFCNFGGVCTACIRKYENGRTHSRFSRVQSGKMSTEPSNGSGDRTLRSILYYTILYYNITTLCYIKSYYPMIHYNILYYTLIYYTTLYSILYTLYTTCYTPYYIFCNTTRANAEPCARGPK